jgi:hypothetical protein
MAFVFAHGFIAKNVLLKISKKKLISDYADIDDYFFGSVAPDIRYIGNASREVTHNPFGKDRVMNNSKFAKYSKAFLAGYETHLIVDDVWSNAKNWLDDSIYDFYGADANNLLQKFLLYGIVDDYFQGESNWPLMLELAGNIFRANDFQLLTDLGFSYNSVLLYRALSAGYLREPGIDTLNVFNFVPSNFEESVLKKFADKKSGLTSFLKDFKKISIEKCMESLEANL